MKQNGRNRRSALQSVKGKVAAMHPLDMSARADAEEGIRQGRADAEQGRVRPAREFFDEFEAKHLKTLPRPARPSGAA